jgi:hypothetical protein
MFYVGCDLHKQSITVCVVDEDQKVPRTLRFACEDYGRVKA